MVSWEITRHQVAIAGRITNAQTHRAIPGAWVEITAGPPAFLASGSSRRTSTAADGHYHFLDLPDGQYTLAVSLPGSGTRYGVAQTQATVSRDTSGKIVMVSADLALPPTTIKGTVTLKDKGDPVMLAEVCVQGSGESTFTDSKGGYMLVGIEVNPLGPRRVTAMAQGLPTVTNTLQLSSAGAVEVLNFVLG